MTIEISAFRRVPEAARGFVKDMRVRWALEEAGLPYRTVLLDQETKASESYRRWQPFGQVPAYRDGTVELFESGAIVLHIAERSEALRPAGSPGGARVATWVLAALNSVEPYADALMIPEFLHRGEAWVEAHRPSARARLAARLDALAAALGDREYLDDRFTAGDLIMTTVLRQCTFADILSGYPSLDAYRLRCEARPAFQRALAAHLADLDEDAPGDRQLAAAGE